MPTSTRSPVARRKLMRAAERLYAEQGFAGTSIRQIATAAEQRNKSAVQYHFTGRDELIKAVLAEHAEAIERHRLPMVEALGPPADVTLADQVSCLILPTIEHHIELGTPSWYGRFLAQALVEPQLREYVITTHLRSTSVRRLNELGHLTWSVPSGGAAAGLHTMIRQLMVHMCAELENDLAHTNASTTTAEPAWRRLGDELTRAICGMSTVLADT
jgi:AcrR family transcriptional regulator